MFLLDWYREYLEIKAEAKAKAIENTVCQTCEALKLELAKAHDRENELLKAITHPVKTEEKPIDIENLKPILPTRHQTFTMRRQMLQAEDRRRADALRRHVEDSTNSVRNESKVESPTTEASTEVDSNLTAELEAELDVVAKEREEQSGHRESA